MMEIVMTRGYLELSISEEATWHTIMTMVPDDIALHHIERDVICMTCEGS
jgi:hypothetical protein